MFELRKRIHIENKKLETLIESVRIGIPIKYACQKAQIPEFYYFKWLKLYNDYIQECESKEIEIEEDVINPSKELDKSKKTEFSYTPVSLILKIKEAYADFVIEAHNKVVVGGKDWTSSAWLLERRARDEYGKEEKPLETNNQVQGIKIVYVDSNSEDSQERLKKLEKEAQESINGTSRN